MNFRQTIFGLALALPASVPSFVAAMPELSLPGSAQRMAQEVAAPASHRLATGPWAEDTLPTLRAEGVLRREAWRTQAPGLTTLALMSELRRQLAAEGFEVIYQCEARACGGFDFRYALDLLPEPAMHVDLGDFRYLAARRGTGEAAEHMALMVSRSPDHGHVQITHVGPLSAEAAAISKSTRTDPSAPLPALVPETIGDALREQGGLPLFDLRFETGSAELQAGDYGSLAALAAWMKDNPEARITLVGHTDFSGPLDVNMDISARRARSVMTRLVEAHDVDPARLEAQGIGFLAPIASNVTEEGRARNRRVEAVLTTPPR